MKLFISSVSNFHDMAILMAVSTLSPVSTQTSVPRDYKLFQAVFLVPNLTQWLQSRMRFPSCIWQFWHLSLARDRGSVRATRIPACRSLGCSMSAEQNVNKKNMGTQIHLGKHEHTGNLQYLEIHKMQKKQQQKQLSHLASSNISSTRCSLLRAAARWSLELRLAAYHRWLWLRVTSQAFGLHFGCRFHHP